jgi:RNA polymerase sigma-70 factor, ECF subfamily
MREIARETIEKASGGDMEAFEQIYNAAADFVYTVARRTTGNADKAADVTQEVFLKIYKNLKKFQFRSSFKTWLYRITVNTSISAHNKNVKAGKKLSAYRDELDHICDQTPTGKEALEIQSKDDLELFMRKLNPQQKTCLILREMEGLSYKEIAKALGIKINTVRSRLKRAREALIGQNQNERSAHAL